MLQYRSLKKKLEESGGSNCVAKQEPTCGVECGNATQAEDIKEGKTLVTSPAITVNEFKLIRSGEDSPENGGKTYFVQEIQRRLPRIEKKHNVFTDDFKIPVKPDVADLTFRLPDCKSDRHTLVLDLDETLVHSSLEIQKQYDRLLHVEMDGNLFDVYVKFRPYLFQFLQEVSKLYEIIVFTSSIESYADKLLDILDPEKCIFHHRIFRDACIQHGRYFIKNLDVLNRDLSRTIIVDDSPRSYFYHKSNGIHIKGYFGDSPSDNELEKLVPLLRHLLSAKDVRLEISTKLDSD
ncbi:hypothetical protein AKO1_007875 [Acrasis kona]|uniref:FCP1 homology domain-containing protein n=1 Tax=Acrasis kona TaxID=1008807 RepID=A0AAW2YN95_9EUKA